MKVFHRKIPPRKMVFITSLMHHGFLFTDKREDLEKDFGYYIPATDEEDAAGIDFWIKMPDDFHLYPIQIGQRGVKIYRKHQSPPKERLKEYDRERDLVIKEKRISCKDHGIIFVLVPDYEGTLTTDHIARSDFNALLSALGDS